MEYLIASDSKYLIDEKLQEMIPEGAEKVIYTYPEADIATILEEASFVAMFQEQKYVIVKQASFFGSAKLSEKDNKALLEYFLHPNPLTSLIFVTYEAVDKRKKITSLFIESNNYISLMSPKNYDLFKDITKKLQIYQIKEDAVRYIIDACLNNYDIIMNECSKLSLYYNPHDVISLEALHQIIPTNINDNVFKFVDAVVTKDAYMAMKLYEDLLVIKLDPIQLLSLLSREYRNLLSYKFLAKKYYTLPHMASELKLADWQVKKLQKEANLYHMDDLKELLIALSEMDYQIKSGQQDKVVAMYAFLVKTFEC